MDPPFLQPPLPPRGRGRPLPQPISTDCSHTIGTSSIDQLSRSAPNQVVQTPASFLNPLYYHVNISEQAKTQRSSSIGEASMHYVGSHKVPTNPVIKFSDSDSDSVYSLESVSSHSVKSERYVEGPVVTMKQDIMDHEYELCEIDRPKVKDIFDLVSFKSPLYGSIKKEKQLDTCSETYDVPLKAQHPHYVMHDSSDSGSHCSVEQSATTNDLHNALTVYDVPIRNSTNLDNQEVCNELLQEETVDEIAYDIPASAILGFDAEILCDVDGMLPPPYPPPPPPIEANEKRIAPKIPPRPLPPPPVPKRPAMVPPFPHYRTASPTIQETSQCSPLLPKHDNITLDTVPKVGNIERTNQENACTNKSVLEIQVVKDPLIIQASRNDNIREPVAQETSVTDMNQSQNVVPPTRVPVVPKHSNSFNLGSVSNKVTAPKSSILHNTSLNTSRFSKPSFTSLPRIKKLAKTLSDLSLRGSSSSINNTASPINSASSSPEPDFTHGEQSTRSGVLICGYLLKVSSNGKDSSQKWYSLENNYLCWYPDHKADCPEGRISRRSISAVSTVLHSQPTCGSAAVEMWCLRIFTVNSHHLLLGARLPSERRDWVQHLATMISPPGVVSSLDPNADLQFAGQVHAKEGVSGKWQKGFLALASRWLHLWLPEISALRRINLQTVAAVEKESSKLQCNSAVERGPVFHVNLAQGVLYMQGDWSLCTETLLSAVCREWTLPPKARLADHYLTPDGLPIIVDKCLKFVSTHGTTLEGIYRLSGSSTKVRQLLESLMQDVWQVHLKTEDYSPHDVASTLKRFLRSLPECLFTEKLYPLWVEASSIPAQEDRLNYMKDLLSHLPEVNYNTIKKVIGHLCMITEHSKVNLMPALNLAPVFGPTLLFRALGETEGIHMTTVATDVVADLISFYTILFQVENQELEKERSIQLAVQKMKEAKIIQKPAGDILVGVYIYSKDWGKCINVRLTPTTTAREICEYALNAGNIMEPLTKIALLEVVCDGALERPLHYSEFVLEVTLRWMSWNQEEAKDNYFCIKHNHVHDAILPVISSLQGQALSVFGDLNFADTSSKNFKKMSFEFTSAKLRYYKTVKNVPQMVGEWNIEDITWYLGAEPKRPPSSKWSFTFIDRHIPVKRTKNNPYFGRTISCRSEDELHKWAAAMLIGEYPQGLVPTICLPDLLT